MLNVITFEELRDGSVLGLYVDDNEFSYRYRVLPARSNGCNVFKVLSEIRNPDGKVFYNTDQNYHYLESVMTYLTHTGKRPTCFIS